MKVRVTIARSPDPLHSSDWTKVEFEAPVWDLIMIGTEALRRSAGSNPYGRVVRIEDLSIEEPGQ